MFLWRAVDDEGEVLDVLVQKRRNKAAALKLLRRLLKKQGLHPATIVTDKLGSYRAAVRILGLADRHRPGGMRKKSPAAPDLPTRTEKPASPGSRSLGARHRGGMSKRGGQGLFQPSPVNVSVPSVPAKLRSRRGGANGDVCAMVTCNQVEPCRGRRLQRQAIARQGRRAPCPLAGAGASPDPDLGAGCPRAELSLGSPSSVAGRGVRIVEDLGHERTDG